jgi:DNA-binding XRE family transcriptional regulator
MMNREEIIQIVSEKIKLVRTENGYTQDQMAELVGISKKTLVQIEKQRITCGWNVAVTVCALFRDSSILQNVMGGDPLEVIELTAHDCITRPTKPTPNMNVWWKTLEENAAYCLQQNLLSHHYRIVDKQGYHVFSSFDEPLTREHYEKIQ